MKVAISVPDRVHLAVDRAARRMRVPRSQFYVRAVEALLERTTQADVTRRLDEVYAAEPVEADPFLAHAAKATFRRSSR